MSNIIADITFALSKNFNFDYKDAEYYMGLRDIKEMKCIFPFSGKIKEGCRAISWSYGLHVQCGKKVINGDKYCFKCQLRKENNKFLGDIDDRLKCKLLDYVDNKGRRTIPWVNYIADRGLNKNLCFRAAKCSEISISDEHLEERIMKRGRPKNTKKKEVVVLSCDLSVLDLGFDHILTLYGDETLAKDAEGNIYDLYDFGAVKRIN